MKISEYKVSPYFEKNIGQIPDEIKYKMKANGYITFFKEDYLVISLPSNKENRANVFYMMLQNRNSDIEIKGKEKQIGIVNYLIGKEKSKWITNIPTFSKIKYEEVYDNIDLYYYINDGNLEYDFILKQGANPDDICISFEGIDSLEMDEDKNVVLSVGDVKALLLKPEVYQIIDNSKISVDCKYFIDEDNSIKFFIEEYEKEYDLVLDPILKLDYSTYIGGYGIDHGESLALDIDGCAYITGSAYPGYPIVPGAYQVVFGGNIDVFVTKVNIDGSQLIYSTYIGGEGAEEGKSIVLDDLGCAYIMGYTTGNYPTTEGSFQPTYLGGSNDVFISKLNQFGNNLLYSTYMGALSSVTATGISVDSEGCAYVTGSTTGTFPTTEGAFQTTRGGNRDAFVSKISADGSKLIYSTYLGGNKDDYGNAIVVDNSGCAYITGSTTGTFPTTEGAFQCENKGLCNAFITKLSSDGSTLIYSTYLGGERQDVAHGIAIDSEGYAYIVGSAQSYDFPIKEAYQDRIGGGDDAFISKVSKDGKSLIYSTYLGGNSTDIGYSIAVDNLGYAYVIGSTRSSNFPSKDAYKSSISGGIDDVFVSKLSADGRSLVYSTYIGEYYKNYGSIGFGIAIDKLGFAYITGYTSGNYPTTENAFQSTFPHSGVESVFATKILHLNYKLSWDYKKDKVKLLDRISTKLSLQNLSGINFDINIKYNTLDSSVTYVPYSLSVQNISIKEESIPLNIYLSNISPQQTAEIGLDLVYNQEKYLEKIPITVEFELYQNISGVASILDIISETFYINTAVGPNYIPGCNKELYNLEIDGELQTTESGSPIIYYKSGTSYIYIEPSGESYIYKALYNPSKVVEHLIK